MLASAICAVNSEQPDFPLETGSAEHPRRIPICKKTSPTRDGGSVGVGVGGMACGSAEAAVTSVSLSFGTTSSFFPISRYPHFFSHIAPPGCLRRRLKLASDRYPLPSSTVRPHTPALAEDPSIGFRDVLRLGTSESHHRRHRLHISSNRLYFTHPPAMLEVSYPCRDSHWPRSRSLYSSSSIFHHSVQV